MTHISEQQAYLMGWSLFENNIYQHHNNCTTINDILKRSDKILQFYKFCKHDILINKNRQLDFLRGIYDRHGDITVDWFDKTKDVIIFFNSNVNEIPSIILSSVESIMFSSRPYTWKGINAIEFLSEIYYDGITCYDVDKYNSYLQVSNPYYSQFYKMIKNNNFNFPKTIPTFRWAKTDENAIPPQKNRFSDSGYDLHIIKKIKEKNGIHYYDTGIKVEPENGFYFDLVGRSSISKTGWMLANNIGIIDASYRGSVIVALKPVSDEPDELTTQLPMKLVQLIPRPLILMTPIYDENMNITVRAEGGFGSSNKK